MKPIKPKLLQSEVYMHTLPSESKFVSKLIIYNLENKIFIKIWIGKAIYYISKAFRMKQIWLN